MMKTYSVGKLLFFFFWTTDLVCSLNKRDDRWHAVLARLTFVLTITAGNFRAQREECKWQKMIDDMRSLAHRTKKDKTSHFVSLIACGRWSQRPVAIVHLIPAYYIQSFFLSLARRVERAKHSAQRTSSWAQTTQAASYNSALRKGV